MARILVTGGTGFIGAPLARELQKSHEVIVLSRESGDIADPRTLERVDRVDHVFHLAGRTFVPDSWKDPVGFMVTNVGGTANVLDYCRRLAAPLTFVSAYIYGKPERLPIREDDTPRPNNPYALSKHLAEQLCEFGARYNGLNVTVVRPFNIYGPGQSEHFLIPIILRQLQRRGAIQLKDLSPKRDYIHVDDLGRLLVQTLTPGPKPYRVVNAGSGESHSVREIVDILQAAAGTSLAVLDEGAARYEELPDVRSDISVAKQEFGWTPRISLHSGLEALVRESASK